ncbi:M48 family metallopeptidase [Thermanaerothrix sp.]|uniref:M48 metallopeptidase family protein n=1 Tax=Thermanaerothrix sp. TaxID=2972675 RepID=UPI002ADDBCF7|nr:M48 family metallopeptidase [Thermanaerothrix sp.]
MNLDKSTLPPRLEESVPLELFKAEVQAWAERIGVTPKSITFRPMKRKWASCSSKGHLTFDTELLYQTAEVRRRVIVHELLHLKIPNHGPLFKALEKAYLEDA